MLTTLLFTLKIKFVLKIGELNGFFIIKQIETSSVSLHFLSTVKCFTTELSTAKALNWLNSVCGFLLFPVPVRCARERNP